MKDFDVHNMITELKILLSSDMAKTTKIKKIRAFWNTYEYALYRMNDLPYLRMRADILEKKLLLARKGVFLGKQDEKSNMYFVSEITKMVKEENGSYIIFFKTNEQRGFDSSFSWLYDYLLE